MVFPGGTVVKNPPANAGYARDTGSIPGSGRSPGVGMATHSSILAWRIPWIEEPGYSPWSCKETDMTDHIYTHKGKMHKEQIRMIAIG